MKPIFAFFISFSLLLIGNLSYARKEPRDYWKSIMKDQPIPDAIKELFHDNPASDHAGNMDHFVKDFDMKRNAIIYHSHVEPQEDKPFVNDDELKEEKSFVKHIKPGLKVIPSHTLDKEQITYN